MVEMVYFIVMLIVIVVISEVVPIYFLQLNIWVVNSVYRYGCIKERLHLN